MLSIGSLFSGVGGLELGLEWAGLGPVRWQVEIEPFCRDVLARHWPDARRFDDVRTVGPELERVGLVCGGFPCQDLSSAGPGAGLDGARSGLWREFARIVGVVRPRFVVVENVPELARCGLDRVLSDLAGHGFDAIWFPLSAFDVGAPHVRERLFVVAYDLSHGGAGLEPVANPREAGPGWARSEADLLAIVDAPFRRGSMWPQPLVRRMDDGIPDRVDRIQSTGNAVSPYVAEVVGHVVRGIHERNETLEARP